MKIRNIMPLGLIMLMVACDDTSSEREQKIQENILNEGVSKVGMPAIKNFREKRLLKEILELRDQEGLTTYTYIWNEFSGKMVFLCNSIGYGLPYATQYSSPTKLAYHLSSQSSVINQADPNGLYSPESAEGTWVLCKDPSGDNVKPLYIEPKIVVSPFELNQVNAEKAEK